MTDDLASSAGSPAAQRGHRAEPVVEDRLSSVLPDPLRRARAATLLAAPVTVVGVALGASLPMLLPADLSQTARVALATLVAAALLLTCYGVRVFLNLTRLRAVLARALTGPDAGEASHAAGRHDEVSASVAGIVRGLRRRARVAEASAEQQRRLATASAEGIVELVTAMVEAEERVRAQIVADLHDTVAQELLVAIYRADQVSEDLTDLAAGDPVAVTGRLTELVEDTVDGPAQVAAGIRSAEQQLRQLMKDARPPELSVGDLGTAVRGLVADLETRNGLRVRITWPEHPLRMPAAWATTVYRFCQESLRNVVKHAQVEEAGLLFSTTGTGVEVVVTDEGVGFCGLPEPTASGHHVGLQLMALRAGALGGSVRTASAPGHGTIVTLSLPLPRPGPPT